MSPTIALHNLWKEKYFTERRSCADVELYLSKARSHFPHVSLLSALKRATYLTKLIVDREVKYVQRVPYSASTESDGDQFIVNAKYDIHLEIKRVVGTKYKDGHYAEAVEASFKEVIKRVKDFVNNKTGQKFDGDKAINRAFGFESQTPLIKFNDVCSEEEKDEQRGIMNLFKGIVGIRNRKAHENVTLKSPERAIEYLVLASLLMRLLDEFMR